MPNLDELMDPTPWGQRGGKKSDAERRIIAMLLKQGTDPSAVGHWTQGAAKAMSAAAGVIRERRADKRAQEAALENQRVIQALIGNTGNVPPQGPESNPISQPQGPSVIPAPQAEAPTPSQVVQSPPQPEFAPPPSFANGPDGEAMPAFSVAPEIPQQQAPITIAPPEAQNSAVVNPPQPVEQPTSVSPQGGLNVAPEDIKRLAKLVMTESIPSLSKDNYEAQSAGIIDTALNRTQANHPKWGNNIRSVVNAPYQFSDINGPVSWRRHGRTDVDQISDAMLNRGSGAKAMQFANEYMAKRAGNAAPASPMDNQGSQQIQQVVGGHLNYANPHFSDRSNLGWINKLDGPRLGAGNAIHHHGTAGNARPVDPRFAVNLTGQQQDYLRQQQAQQPQLPSVANPDQANALRQQFAAPPQLGPVNNSVQQEAPQEPAVNTNPSKFESLEAELRGIDTSTPEGAAAAQEAIQRFMQGGRYDYRAPIKLQSHQLPEAPYQVAALGPDVPMPMPPQTSAALPPEAMPPQPPSPAPEQLAQVNALGTPPSPNDFGFRAPASAQQAQAPIAQAAQPSAEQRIAQSIAQAPQQQQKPINPAIIRALTSGDPTTAAIGKLYLQKHLSESAPTTYEFGYNNGQYVRKDKRSGRIEVINPYTNQVITDPSQVPQGAQKNEYGLNPIYAQDENGNTVPVQLGKDGKPIAVQLPNNLKLSPKGIKVDLGTHEVFINPYNMQPLGPPMLKDIAGAAEQKAVGKGKGEAIVNAPKVEAQQQAAKRQANIVVQDIDAALEHIKNADLPTTGFFGNVLKNVSGTAAHDISKLMDTVKSAAALDKIQAMRAASTTGAALGAVSDKDMDLLKAAIGNLEQSQSKPQFITNLNRVRKLYSELIDGPESAAPAVAPPAQQQAPATAPKVRKFNPATGRIE